MIFYLSGVSIFLTYFIFRSVGIDYRLIAVGSFIPFLIDLVIGHASIGHSFMFTVSVFVLIMIGTIKRPRLLRRRLLCISIGMFFALVLEGAFLHEQLWWWPSNLKSSGHEISMIPSFSAWVIRDVIGLIAFYVIFAMGELHKKEKRQDFIKSGRISL